MRTLISIGDRCAAGSERPETAGAGELIAIPRAFPDQCLSSKPRDDPAERRALPARDLPSRGKQLVVDIQRCTHNECLQG